MRTFVTPVVLCLWGVIVWGQAGIWKVQRGNRERALTLVPQADS